MGRFKDPLAPQPPPSPSREDSREIVEAIVAAAVELADPNVTLNAIAERAGVGVASVYRYFPSKGAIYAEISRRLHRKFLEQLRCVLAEPPGDLRGAVRKVCEVVVVGPAISPALRRCLNVIIPVSWSQESADDVFGAAIREITAWLTANIPSPPDNLAERVFVAFSAGRGLVAMSMVFPDLAPSSEALIDHMTRGTLCFLLGDDGATTGLPAAARTRAEDVEG